VAENFVTK